MLEPFSFQLPPELVAKEPPERRGIGRDQVRLLVIERRSHRIQHTRFDQIADLLSAGDLLVFNASRTIPASLEGCSQLGGPCMEVRLAEHLPDDSWLALLLCKNGDPFECGLRYGMQIHFGPQLSAKVFEQDENILRLWRLRFSRTGSELLDMLYRIGQPIRYEYVSSPWALDEYQTIYAREPGSAEMPSAGRALTWKVFLALRRRGVKTAFLTLHTGLSSYMDDNLDAKHPISEEEYYVGGEAAQQIEHTRSQGGRIMAIGTTVVRALESAADASGKINAGHSYTRLRISAEYKLRIADGLLTGLHEPQASHLDLLSAFLPPRVIRQAYQEAIQRKYLWHEFGDLNLIL